MTEEELQKKAKEYAATEQEKNCILGVYDSIEDFQYDEGYNRGYVIGLEEGYIAGAKENGVVWHDLSKNPDDLPKVDSLVRVRLMSGMEHICETCYYEPSEDEIGYGKLILSFYELNGEWIDDAEIIAWCEIPKFKGQKNERCRNNGIQ